METNPACIARSPEEGRCIAIVGDLYRFLATGAETDGRYALWEAIVPPGGGPPPHTHSREVEFFQILEGEVTLLVGDETIVAGPGHFVHMPIGTRHAFRNESETTARMLIGVAPAGIEEMFFEVGVPLDSPDETPQPPTEEEIARLLATAPRYGITIEAPPP
ncbi:Quercetin 2,3-dioxygenase [Maioricimonas rarisocia]|uniref:Quercetin 2,3-dioxygenase n=1 Tax=Maioricimonas rarisocia TaxID=2528026 RepID=A0A517Z6G1_9PLAN|nr:cupin domain-containing protein [Maioricimonas rarisocia]QDU38080.1 Quercetin 2,3-dioxygenase [Maioricimonas rarisocia]